VNSIPGALLPRSRRPSSPHECLDLLQGEDAIFVSVHRLENPLVSCTLGASCRSPRLLGPSHGNVSSQVRDASPLSRYHPLQHQLVEFGRARGRPLRGLTGLIEKAVQAAGLPSHCVAHGLRKAALRRLAEHGSTTKEIAAMSGHRSLTEIERYTARADQARLAQSAVAKLPDENRS